VQDLSDVAAQSGMTLIELALAFVTSHRAVTAAIIGPRTMEQLDSQLPAAEIELPHDVLDRIDEIVAPGVNVKPDERGWDPPWLSDASLRRR
jgi:aryl-alcohol dehydrogenase-like predicted oxidoreductase